MTASTADASSPPPAHRRTVSRRDIFAWTLLTIAALLTGLWFAQGLNRRRANHVNQLPVLGELPVFTLTDQSGEPFGSKELYDHVWVANFFFTACPGPCLVMNQRMKELRAALPAGARCVSITIDPQTDQPAVLRRYAARFGGGAPDPSWFLLTGTQEAIYRLAREGFRLAAAGPAETDPADRSTASFAEFLHSTRFALVDGQGKLRGYYESTEVAELQRLRTDVVRLSMQPQNQP